MLYSVPPPNVGTHRPIVRGLGAESAVELANSIPESDDYTTDSVILGRLSLSNMFNILNPMESAAYWSQPMVNWPSGYGPLKT